MRNIFPSISSSSHLSLSFSLCIVFLFHVCLKIFLFVSLHIEFRRFNNVSDNINTNWDKLGPQCVTMYNAENKLKVCFFLSLSSLAFYLLNGQHTKDTVHAPLYTPLCV